MAINKIDAKTLKDWNDKGEAVILDVREPAEHRAQKIAGAYNISYTIVTNENLPKVADNSKLVLHCHSGRRSSLACQKLLEANPSLELYELEGGISSWVKNNFKTESSGKTVIPIDRQVQITIGILLIFFSILSFAVSVKFIGLVVLIGCGLLFAGLSGTCMLALLIAKMPWNK